MTDSYYIHSIAILKERFGQQYKLVGARLEALLNVQAPANNLTGLQESTIITRQANLELCYGSLLTSVILNKIPNDIKVHMGRDHHDTESVIDELLASILKEIRINPLIENQIPVPTQYNQIVPTVLRFPGRKIIPCFH